MLKKYFIYTIYLHKVYFSEVHKLIFFILMVTQTSSLSIFCDAIY